MEILKGLILVSRSRSERMPLVVGVGVAILGNMGPNLVTI